MSAPTYNCPFSAASDQSDDCLTCAEVLALNTNAGCALYNTHDEECYLRQYYQGRSERWEYANPTERWQSSSSSSSSSASSSSSSSSNSSSSASSSSAGA